MRLFRGAARHHIGALFALAAAVAGLLAGAAPAVATPASDLKACPIAWQRYSVDSPFVDILTNPETRKTIEVEAPRLLRLPIFLNTTPPTLAGIVSPRTLNTMLSGHADLERLDKALASSKVTLQAARERCARYETKPPVLARPTHRPAILIFDKSTGFKDEASVNAASAALADIARRRGWSVTSTGNAAVFNPAQLAMFDTVVWNNVSGDVLNLPQRKAFRNYIVRGGGFAGVHGSGGDFIYLWNWYVDQLIGARFAGHPETQQDAVVLTEASPITQGLPSSWRMKEEWYSFHDDPRQRGVHVLAKLDETSYAPGASLKMGDHPIAWSHCVGKGRSFYTAIGHRVDAYSQPQAVQLLEQGIAWTLDRKACPARQ